jgi:2-methylcitrate dehydratase
MGNLSMVADDSTRGAYDQVLVDVIAYVFHYEVESPRAWQHAKAAILDAIGCSLETLTKSAEARAIIGPVIPGTVVPNGFKLPGTRFQLDPVKGAFDLGSLIRYLDHNDAFAGAEWGHPSGEW